MKYSQNFLHLVQSLFNLFHNLSVEVYQKLEQTIPGFDTVMERVQAESIERQDRRKAIRAAEKKAEKEFHMSGRVQSDK